MHFKLCLETRRWMVVGLKLHPTLARIWPIYTVYDSASGGGCQAEETPPKGSIPYFTSKTFNPQPWCRQPQDVNHRESFGLDRPTLGLFGKCPYVVIGCVQSFTANLPCNLYSLANSVGLGSTRGCSFSTEYAAEITAIESVSGSQ